jgi:hypothetical protein
MSQHQLLQHVVGTLRWGVDGCKPALPVRGAADAGAVARRAHPSGVLRHRLPSPRAVRRVPLSAHRRPAMADAGETLVADHARTVRGGRRHRHDLVLRARAAMAGVDAGLRQRVRAGLHAGGVLLLHRSHLHRDLRVRLGPATPEGALPVRHPDRDRGRRGLAVRHLRQRVDEPPHRVHAARRPGGRRASLAGAVRQPDVLERVRAHVLRRLHRDRVRARRRVRVGVPARPSRPLRARRARHHDGRRVGGGAVAGHRRRLGRQGRGSVSAGQAGRDGGPGADDTRRRRAPGRLVQRARGRLGGRDPAPAVDPRRPQPERGRQGPEHRPARRPAAGQRSAALLPGNGRDRHAASADRTRLPVPAVPAPPAPPAAVLGGGRRGPAVGGRADHRLDHHRGRPPAVDRLRRDASQPGGHRGERHPGRLRHAERGLRDPGGHRRRHLAAAGQGAVAARTGGPGAGPG